MDRVRAEMARGIKVRGQCPDGVAWVPLVQGASVDVMRWVLSRVRGTAWAQAVQERGSVGLAVWRFPFLLTCRTPDSNGTGDWAVPCIPVRMLMRPTLAARTSS